jgi:peptidoglycan hydrolase CwlO-like protein
MEAERRQKRIKNLKDTAIGWLVFIGAIWLISQCSSSTSSNGGSSGGNTYRVPSHSSSDLSSDRNTIETAKANLNALDSELQSMGNKIESERLSIDSTSQFAVDQFNQEVARYNAKLEQAKADSQALNTMVDNYNAKLRQPGR